MSEFLTTLVNTTIASSEHGVTTTNKFKNIPGDNFLASLRRPAIGVKDGSHFLRSGLKIDNTGTCLPRADNNTESIASVLIIDCDKRININGEVLEGAPDPYKISQILRENNIGHVLYGSHSHYVGTKGNRYRIIMTTQRPYTKEQLGSTLESLISLINASLNDDLLASATENNAWPQPWYYPRKPANSSVDDLYLEHLDGKTVEVVGPFLFPPIDEITKREHRQIKNGEISVIDTFNEQYPLAGLLIRLGYKKICATKEQERWLSPQSKTGQAGIIVRGNKFFSHHGSCPFNDGYWHDAFDLMKSSEKLTDEEAVKKAAQSTLAPDGSSVAEYNKKFFSLDKSESKNDWSDPEPIKHELQPVDQLTKELIPEPYRDFITDVAERMQCAIDFVAAPLLTITSILIGAGCGIKPKENDDWIVIPNLWGVIVGRPGIMKSPAVAESMHFLDKLQNESEDEYEENFKKYEKELKNYEIRKKMLEKELERAYQHEYGLLRSGKKDLPPLSQDKLNDFLDKLLVPLKPVRKRFKTNDSTVEKVTSLLSENQRGMLGYRDEIIGLLRSFDKIGHETDRAFYLESWNGTGSYTVDRIGSGTTHVENLCLSLFGTTQPDKLLKYLHSAVNGDNDGLVQRFQLMVYPDDLRHWQLIDKKPDLEARTNVFKILEQLSKMDFVAKGATQDEKDRFPYFQFSDQAQRVFNEWITDLEINKLRSPDLHPLLIEHLSKFRSLMPSLALIFHLIEVALASGSNKDIQKSISEQNAMLACAWCDYLESHAVRVYGLIMDVGTQAAAILADKLRQGKLKDGFTWRDVQRNTWSLLKDKDIFREACDELIDLGWLKKTKTTRGNPAYLINPKIKGEKR